MNKIIRVHTQGQALIEFIFLILMTIMLSLTLVKAVNVNVGDRWAAMIKLVIGHDLHSNAIPNIELR